MPVMIASGLVHFHLLLFTNSLLFSTLVFRNDAE